MERVKSSCINTKKLNYKSKKSRVRKILNVSFEWLALGKMENGEQQNEFQNLFNRQSPTSQKYLTKFVASVV
jgi:hypothetical protein